MWSYLDSKLVLEGNWKTVKRTDEFSGVLERFIQLFGTCQGHLREELESTVGLDRESELFHQPESFRAAIAYQLSS
jgi:hypothetical protein